MTVSTPVGPPDPGAPAGIRRGGPGGAPGTRGAGGRPPRLLLGLTLVGVGALWAAASLGLPLRWGLLLPAAVVVLGVLVLVGGGRVPPGAWIWFGVVLAVLATVLPPSPGGAEGGAGVGDQMHRISDPVDLEPGYSLGMGVLTLDLRDLELPDGVTELSARVGAGELVVLAPADAAVRGEATVGLGELSAWGRSRGGLAPRGSLADAGPAAAPVLDLDLGVGLGRLEVTR